MTYDPRIAAVARTAKLLDVAQRITSRNSAYDLVYGSEIMDFLADSGQAFGADAPHWLRAASQAANRKMADTISALSLTIAAANAAYDAFGDTKGVDRDS